MSTNPSSQPPDSSPFTSTTGFEAEQPLLLQPGSQPVPGYELIRKRGAGGFGEVWQASGPGGIDVALKFIRLDTPGSEVELRSLEVMKSIRHPHLVSLFGVWHKDNLLILAMELCDRSLQDRLAEALEEQLPGIPLGELLNYMRDAARGLDALHAKTVQHRDVKPLNLLLMQDGVKVADFGLAKVLEHTAGSHSGALTMAYAAPEFFKGETSQHSDQYSLAATYFELRTGRLLFEGDSHQMVYGHLQEKPDLSSLPVAERAVVAQALAKLPAKRWPSCEAFVNALQGADKPTPPERKKRVKPPKSPPTRKLPTKQFANSLGMEFVLALPATFWMGNRGSQHQVEIPHQFYIGIYPVTQEQWQALMGNKPSCFSRTGGGKNKVRDISDADLKQFPVEQVSWKDIQAFIKKLNAREQNSEWMYRLPTEAEWEYVCRGGATAKKDCSFNFYFDQPTNRALSSQANFNDNLGRTTKVGSYKANRLGVFDMHGNVWEWCPEVWEAWASDRVVRGGDWSSTGKFGHASDRGGFNPAYRGSGVGFRLARVPFGQ